MSTVIEQEETLQMSFLDHLDELRKRLINSVIIIAAAFALCFAFSDYIYRFLAVPVVQQLQKERRTQQESSGNIDISKVKEGEIVQYTFTREIAVNDVKVPLGTTIPVKRITVDKTSKLVLASPWSVGKSILPAETPLDKIFQEGDSRLFFDDENNRLVLRGVTSAFMVYVRVALYSGIALAVPFLFYQLWAFISPGLYKHEKKYIVPVLFMATLFFTLGASFAYKIAFPAACDYLLGWAEQGGFRTLLDAEDYLDLIIMIMIGLGIVFQIPTIAFVLGRIGLITPRLMIRVWRYAVVVIAIIAAVLTPTPDAFNMMMFAAPMLGLYFLSIGIVWIFGKPRRSDAEVDGGE
ncbi:MAG: twin-arginine translocase subunit TatC [Blastocatellales bacterium]